MAQPKVTQYFASRKRVFDVIQPSKKVKLEAECEVPSRTSDKSPDIVQLQPLSASIKPVAKRKNVTGKAGNIKTFLETVARYKMPKLCPDISNQKVIENSKIFKPDGSVDKVHDPLPSAGSPDHSNRTKDHSKSDKAMDCLRMVPHTSKDCTLGSSSHSKAGTKNVSFHSNGEKRTTQPGASASTVQERNKPQKSSRGAVSSKNLSSVLSNIKKTLNTELPVKTDENIPAYQKYHSLADKDSENSLVLPFKYKRLLEMFQSVETIVSMLYNRKEVCTFDKLKHGVLQLLRRTFNREHLAQLATVFPDAYTFQLEKGIKYGKGKENHDQLTITPILAQKRSSSLTPQGSMLAQMTPTVLLDRRKTFNQNLISITKEHHELFLANMEPPLCVPKSQILRWHPRFPLDSVPDIPPSPLPESVDVKVVTAQDVLQNARGVVGDRVEKALESVANEKTSAPVNKNTPMIIASGAFKGISQALLDRIRNKENAKIARDMLRKPESEKRLEHLSCLPEVVRIVRTLFVAEKRAAISMNNVVMKVCDSFHSPISREKVEKLLKLLSQVVPKWISYVTISKGVFLKIDKNMNVSEITKAIDLEILKEKS